MTTIDPGELDGEEVRPSSSPQQDDTMREPNFQRNSTASVTKIDPMKVKRDECIMDSNNSSIVSKRSVEKLYYGNEPEYFRYFVSKLKRRSPLVNRGYWLRMKAVEHTVTRFLAERTAKRKVVVNLGCG